MASPNRLTLDFAQNPAMRDYFGTKRVGDQCSFGVTMQVTNVGDESVTGHISVIEIEDKYGDAEAVKPSGEEPVMVIMKG
jgi:hypothetical protein